MKLKIGNQLQTIRIDQGLKQQEIAELLGLSLSTYARLERNETSAELTDLMRYSEILNVPVSEFLPETLALNNRNNDNNIVSGMVFGNFTYNANSDIELTNTKHELEKANIKIKSLEDKIQLLNDKIAILERYSK